MGLSIMGDTSPAGDAGGVRREAGATRRERQDGVRRWTLPRGGCSWSRADRLDREGETDRDLSFEQAAYELEYPRLP